MKKFQFIFLIICSVNISACSPKIIPIPKSTPQIIITPQQIIAPTQIEFEATMALSHIPWSLDSAISELPEVYTKALSQETIESYKSMLIKLPEDVQKWIVGVGWALEDLVIDNNENTLFKLLVDKNITSSLSILTRPEILDDLSSKDISWAKGYEVSSIKDMLQDDLDDLTAKGLISEKSKTDINSLLMIAERNYEVSKGFYIIKNYGIPNSKQFGYPVPDYNTQLLFLSKLLELGIPEGYEVSVLAASLDYGSLWTIADDELRTSLPQYTHDLILFQAQTDLLIDQKKGNWQAKSYPLEAQITLVWGAPGDYFPLTQEEADRIHLDIAPNKSWAGYREVFADRKMSKKDWEFVSIEPSTLNEMREYLLKNNYLTLNTDQIAGKVFQKFMENINYQWSPEITDIEGWLIFNSYICNPDWQWKKVKGNNDFLGRAIGTSGDAYFHTFLLKSINLSGFTPSHIVHQSGYYDFNNQSWKASTTELSISSDYKIDTRFGWNKVPYDNYWLQPIKGNFSGRQNILFPSDPYIIWRKGLPKGYIFRADLAKEPFPPLQ